MFKFSLISAINLPYSRFKKLWRVKWRGRRCDSLLHHFYWSFFCRLIRVTCSLESSSYLKPALLGLMCSSSCVCVCVFLRHIPGQGSQLQHLGSMSPSSSLSPCSEARVTQFIRQFVASCLLVSDTNTELSYVLPSEAVKKGCFERLFQVHLNLHGLFLCLKLAAIKYLKLTQLF